MVDGSLTDVSAEARAIPATAPTWGNPTVGEDLNPRGLPYIFVWPAVEGATSYDVEFSFDGLTNQSDFGEPNVFISPIHQVFDVVGNSCELPDVAGIRYGKLHYWHVKPKNTYGDGAWSSPLNTFVVDVPVPVKVAPLAGAVGTQLPLVMDWTPANPAKWADVLFGWVVYNAAGTVPMGYASDVTTTTYNYEDAVGETQLLLDVTYQWQVRGYANPLAPKLPTASDHRWTAKTAFTTGGAMAGAFDVLAPLDAILVSSEPALVDFSWEAAAGAIYYKLYIEEVGSGSPMVYQVDVGTSHSVALAPAKQYTWWVGAWNYAGETLSTSTRTLSTKTMVPALVSVVCDVTAQAGGTAIVGWSIGDDSGISGYRVKYGTVSGSYTGVSADIAAGTLEASVTGLTNGMTYFFVVVSFDGSGVESDISNEKSVMITDEVPPVLAEASFDASAHPAGSRVSLNWAIPAEFNRVKIVRAEGGYAAAGTDPETNPDAGVALVCASSDSGLLTFVDDGSNNISSVAISDPIIPGIAIPAAGQTPTTNINAVQFMGTISWSPADSTFAPNTAYTATITLTPKVGYTLTGVIADFFTVQGATATNAADSGVVAAVYPATGLLSVDLSAIPGITNPVAGEIPVTSVDSAQYTGTVSWSPSASTFAAVTVYTATVNLMAKTGYTLTGVPADFFTVNGIAATNSANSGTVTVAFPATTGTLAINPTYWNAGFGAQSKSIAVTSNVSWTASSNQSWLTITSGASGTGNGAIMCSLTENSTAGVRSAIVTVTGSGLTGTCMIEQAGMTTVGLSAIPGIVNPATGEVPVTLIDSAEYTGSVVWSPAHNPFQLDVAYSATITLIPKTGYTLTGVPANFFTVNGITATNAVDSGVITVNFPATVIQVITLFEIPDIVSPVVDGIAALAVDSVQYTGSVVWSPVHSPFQAGTLYSATITLTPKVGYTLTGVPANFFTVNGVAGTNTAGSGVVNVSFPATEGVTLVEVATGSYHTLGLSSTGRVVGAGQDDYGQVNGVSAFNDIIHIGSGVYCQHSLGVRADGTVVAVGRGTEGQLNVASWTNIVQVSGSSWHSVGRKSNGMVVAVGANYYGQCNVSSWANVVYIVCGLNNTFGVLSNGTVVVTGSNNGGETNVSSWTDIVQMAVSPNHAVGLKSNGTVVAAGVNTSGQCDVTGWSGITHVAVTQGGTIGLKADGTVVTVGSGDILFAAGWTDIVQMHGTYAHLIGLKSNGNAVAVGQNTYGQINVSYW
jgi:hypothetical protein